MRKYLCLWCMSTKNHNILCFVYVPRIKLLNKGICLWKAPKALAGRGFRPAKNCPKSGAASGNRNRTTPKPKPSPCRGWGQDAETVHFDGVAVGDVEIWADTRGRGQQGLVTTGIHCSKCGLAGIIC